MSPTYTHTNTNLMLLSQYVPAITTQTLWLPTHTHTHTPHTHTGTHTCTYCNSHLRAEMCSDVSGAVGSHECVCVPDSCLCACPCVRVCVCICVCWRSALIWQSRSSGWSPVQLIWLDVDPTGLVSSNMLPVSSCSPARHWVDTHTNIQIHTHTRAKKCTHLTHAFVYYCIISNRVLLEESHASQLFILEVLFFVFTLIYFFILYYLDVDFCFSFQFCNPINHLCVSHWYTDFCSGHYFCPFSIYVFSKPIWLVTSVGQ